MNPIRKFTNLLFKDEEGNTATEYAIMMVLIVIVCLTGILSTSDFQQAIWQNTADKVEAIIP